MLCCDVLGGVIIEHSCSFHSAGWGGADAAPCVYLIPPPAPPPHTHTQVFHLMNTLIERLQEGIKPFVPGIMQLLPGVWGGSEGQSLLRIQVCKCERMCVCDFVCVCICL